MLNIWEMWRVPKKLEVKTLTVISVEAVVDGFIQLRKLERTLFIETLRDTNNSIKGRQRSGKTNNQEWKTDHLSYFGLDAANKSGKLGIRRTLRSRYGLPKSKKRNLALL